MKTQISQLKSGIKNQLLNPEMDYSDLPKATSHVGHSGSNHVVVKNIWRRVIEENTDTMKVIVKGLVVELKANWSLSRKSVTYWGILSKVDLEEKFFLKAAKNENPTISIQQGNIIVVSNGKNSFCHVCPSLIEII